MRSMSARGVAMPFLDLLLELVQDINRGGETDSVHCAVRAPVEVSHDFEHTSGLKALSPASGFAFGCLPPSWARPIAKPSTSLTSSGKPRMSLRLEPIHSTGLRELITEQRPYAYGKTTLRSSCASHKGLGPAHSAAATRPRG